MSGDIESLWQAVNELRREHSDTKVEHASKHAELDGRINLVVSGLADVKNSVDVSRRERTAQYEDIKATLGDISREVSEARGAARFGKQVVGWLLALGVPPALFAWYTHGGGS